MDKVVGLAHEFDAAKVRYEGLTAPILASDLRVFRAGVTSAMRGLPAAMDIVRLATRRLFFGLALWLVLGTLPLGLAATAIILLLADSAAISARPLSLLISGAVFGVALFLWIARAMSPNVRLAKPWRRWLRLARFADDNGFQFVPVSGRLRLPGAVFTQALPGVATDRLVHVGKPIELGTYLSGELDGLPNPRARGYLAIGLNRALPHMVLRATANERGQRGMPGAIRKDQILRLEGDFNKHFTLYAPRAYERDALYVFAPDLMTLMIDEASKFDVEVVDNWIFFYSPRPFNLESQETVKHLLQIVRVIGEKTLRQTDRYWDDRSGWAFADNRVGASGRRLRIKVALGISGVIILLILFQIYRFMF